MNKKIKNKKIITKTIVLASILLFSVIFANFEQENNKNTPLFVSALTPHSAIYITDDSGFSEFPGTGTSVDPYVIEGYSIVTNEMYGIYIEWTSKHFVIKNCYVDAGTYGLVIYFVGVGTATITNNTVTNNDYGLYLYGSDSNSVSENNCSYNSDTGIYIYNSDSNSVSENNCSYNSDTGIYLYGSTNNSVNKNNCSYNNYYGIYLSGSDSNSVSANNCSYNNYYGIYLYGSTNNSVSANNCSYNDYGIRLQYSYDNWVSANNCSYNFIGIYLYGSTTNSVSANNCTNNSDTGIYLYGSTTNSVNENNCSYNNYGISLDGSSNDNSVSANNCSYNVNNGITLAGSSNGNSVSENNCSYNDYGINLLRSNTTSIIENFLQYNDDYGVRITSLSFSNLIYKNSFDTNNLGGTSQAYDDGADNHWFHLLFSRGNYWSDWNGSEYYYIDGSANSFDPYPIEYPQTPPTITAVSHDPSNPTELETITISATVTDLSGVDIVTLRHRINGGSWISIAMTLSTGSLYQVTIGPFTEGSVIEYYIYAEDNSSNHNEAIEDNFGAYYSFTVSVDITEFSSLSPLLLLSLSLLLLVTVPILYKRKRT